MSPRNEPNPLPELGEAFQAAMDPEERHQRGAHYTRTTQILEIVRPTLERPFLEQIDQAKTLEDCLIILKAVRAHRVLDPACGCGHFLFIAYQVLRCLEDTLLDHIKALGDETEYPKVGVHQLYGIDQDPGALTIAKRVLSHGVRVFGGPTSTPNLTLADALFHPWPRVDTIMGNPPFQSKNKRQQVWGAAAIERLQNAFPNVPGRADYCVYFLRKAHDHLAVGQRAGFVGTNTIRENDSRRGGLEYIVSNNGTITDAISNQRWEGDAAVYVSVVNWVKGEATGPFRLSWETADGQWQTKEVATIPASLRAETDVTTARPVQANCLPKQVFQGQTHGHPGFLVPEARMSEWLETHPELSQWLHPFLNGRDLLRTGPIRTTRYVIDVGTASESQVQSHPSIYEHLHQTVHPTRQRKAQDEHQRNAQRTSRRSANQHHANFFRRWWQLSYRRTPLIARLDTLERYIACSRVSRFPIFRFVPAHIRPSDAIAVFCFDDLYSFGILHSSAHCQWFAARCSTLGIGLRYTSKTVFDSFVWPQSPTPAHVSAVAQAAAHLIAVRERFMMEVKDLTALYSAPPPALQDAHDRLNQAVFDAYGFDAETDILASLLSLNEDCRSREAAGESVTGPGALPR